MKRLTRNVILGIVLAILIMTALSVVSAYAYDSGGLRNHISVNSGSGEWLSVATSQSAMPLTILNSSGAGVPDNANNWIFGQNNASPYINYIKESVGGNEKLWYQPNTIIQGTTLPNRDAGGNDAVITWGSNPVQVAYSWGSLLPTQVISANTTAANYVGDFMPTTVNTPTSPTLAQAETAVQNDPFYNFYKPFADASGTGAIWFYWMATVLTSLVFFILAYKSKHLLIAAIAFDIPYGFGIAVGFIPWYVIVFLVIWTIGAAVQEARVS